MSHPTLCLFLLALLQACQPQPAETTQPTPPTAAAPAASPAAAAPTLAQRLSPIMSGYWVSTEYLDEVARTRSPKAAFDHTPPAPSSLAISPFASQQDSVSIGASYGLHEGGDMLLLLRPSIKANSFKIKLRYGGETGTTAELAYQFTPTDTVLFYITRHTKTHRIISKNAYRRTGMPSKEADLEAGVARGVNDLLVTGSYIGKDSSNQPIKAQFFTNGLVKGLPFKKYTVQTDFTGPNPGNSIYFDVYIQAQQELAASFGRDSLKLYTIHSTVGIPAGETDTTQIFTRGRLRYQLMRVKKP